MRAPLLWLLSLTLAPPVALAQDSGRREAGRRIYLAACANCHGEDGDGHGPGAGPLDPEPRDFTAGVFKFRSTGLNQPPLVEDLVRTIGNGIPGTAMPSFRPHLTQEELTLVAEFVLGFHQPDEPPERLLPPVDSLRAPPSTPALVEKGRALFEKLTCVQCHGNAGRGDGILVLQGLTDSQGRKVRMPDLVLGRYQSGPASADLYRTIVTGVDGTPMPSWLQLIPAEEDRWALVAYVQSLGRHSGWRTLFGEQNSWR